MFNEEIKKEFFEQFTDNCDKDNDYYDSQFTEGRPCRVYDFMMAQIKQAEERERERIVKIIKETYPYKSSKINVETLLNIITNQ